MGCCNVLSFLVKISAINCIILLEKNVRVVSMTKINIDNSKINQRKIPFDDNDRFGKC